MRRLSLVLLLLATALRAENAPREIFPSDYTPSSCAPPVSCISFDDSQMGDAAFRFLALELDLNWIQKHAPEIKAAIAPLCRKHATCQTMPMNSYMFCDDVLAAETRPLCDTMFPIATDPHGSQQCKRYVETYLMGIDQNAIKTWKQAQACTAKQPPVTHTKPLIVWMSPESLPYDYKGDVTFYAIDPDTKVPVLATVKFEGQTLFAPVNPAGATASYYPFPLPFKYVRVPNGNGHTDAVPPLVTVTAPGYPDSSFRLPAVVPKAIVEMQPPTIGSGPVTVVARDSISGKPIDGRVMLGNDEVGFTNQPITIAWTRGTKRPELWLKPYLNRYSDVVLLPAEK